MMEEFVSESGLKAEVASVLHSVFEDCDTNQDGLVNVPDFIHCMKEKATGLEMQNFLDDLTPILNEESEDLLIDWSMCEIGLKKWIEKVNNSTLPQSKSTNMSQNSPIKQLFERSSKIINSPYPFGAEKVHGRNVSNTYSNDSCDFSDSLSWDHSDIQGRLDDLELTNRRLLEDNTKLKYELLNTEDQNSLILQENDQMKSTITRHEKMLEESRKLQKSIEELKLTVVEYQNLKNDLIDKTCQLEKENNSLHQTIADYENKILQLDTSLELVKEEKKQLTHEVSLQQNLLNHIEDLKTSKECIVEESENKSEYMSALIAELSLANEELKAQKNTIENELSEVKQDVCRISMINQIHSTPLMSSTRCEPWVPSLQQELIAEMENENDTYNGEDTSLIQHLDFSDASDISPSVSKPGSPKQYSRFAQQCRSKFKEKKQLVFGKIEEIVKQQEKSNDNTRASLIVEDLNRDLESFTEKIAEFAQGKQTAERRAHKLATAYKKLKEEKESLGESKDKVLQRVGDLSINSQDAQKSLEEALEEIEEYKQEIIEMRNEIKMLKVVPMQSEDKSCQFSTTQTHDNSDHEEAQNQIEELKRLVSDLESRNLDISRKIFDLEEELSSRNEELLNERNAKESLELSLQTLKIDHSGKIQSFLKMIPNQREEYKIKDEAVSWNNVQNKLEGFINGTMSEHRKLLGVRESPDGGPRCSETSHDAKSLYKPHSRALLSNSAVEHFTTACQTDDICKKEISIQTDLDLLIMNKLLDTSDIFSPNTGRIPERLLKYTSIQTTEKASMTDVICDPETRIESDLSQTDHTEEIVVRPPKEKSLETEQSINSDEECKENDIIHTETESIDTISNVSLDLKHDENNNEKILINDDKKIQLKIPQIELPSSVSLQNNDRDISESQSGRKSPVSLFVANIIEYGRSDISSDSDTDIPKNRKLSSSRIRRKRNQQQQQRQLNSTGDEESVPDISLTEGSDTKRRTSGGTSKPRRRRHGVSAEPVRVSWSTLRESFKKLQETANRETFEQNSDMEGQEAKDTESLYTTDIEGDQLDSLTQPIPAIHVHEHDNDQTEDSKTPDDTGTPNLSPKTSLRVPPQHYQPLTPSSTFDFTDQSYIDDKELEKKFTNIVLSFKTDMYTLQKRLETQERARDVSESSMEKEIMKLHSAIGNIQKSRKENEEFQQIIFTLERQTEILRKAAMKVSAQSEQHGSYQQENRMCGNFETILQYTDALRFNMSKMKNELEDLRLCSSFELPDEPAENSSQDVKNTDNEFPKTETIENTQEEPDEDEPKQDNPTPLHTFSSISKKIVMAQSISKLRQKSSSSDTDHSPDLSPKTSQNDSPRRVKFGEISFSEDKVEPESSEQRKNSLVKILQHHLKLSKKILSSFGKFIPLILTLFLIYVILYVFVRSLEIDTLKLHDRLLQFIPHTIEPARSTTDKS